MTPPANSPRNSRYGGPTAPRQQHPGSPRWTQYCTLATFGTASAFICCCGIPTGIRLIVGCLQPQCFDWVAELSSSLDLKRDPCDNFYEYVCGQKPAVNAFVRLSLSVHMSFFKKLITLDPDDEREALSMSEKRAAMLTLRCFQQAFSGRNHLGFVRDVMSEFELSWPPLRNASLSVFERLVELSLTRGVHLLFEMKPATDRRRPDVKVLKVGFNLPLLMEWAGLRSRLLKFGVLHTFFTNVARTISRTRVHPQLIERVLVIDNMVMTMVLPQLGERPNVGWTRVRFGALSNLTDADAWLSVSVLLDAVNQALRPGGVQLSEHDELVAEQGPPFRLLWRLLWRHGHSESLRGYAALMLARYLAPEASPTLTELQFFGPVSRVQAAAFMVSHCVRGAVDDLPYVTGRMFERWYLSGPENDYQVRAARSMVDRVIDATRRGFLELRWIDEPTRRHVVERIDDLELIVGLPHNLSTDAQLDDHHSYLSQVDTDEDTYPDMMWALRRAMVEARLRLLNASLSPPSAAVTLNMPMLLVNAFYVPSEHVIAIPLAIMLPPFQQRGLPAALNYGSLGHVIGHEITHSCDEHVGPLNESGTHIDPWSEESRANFRERLRCLRRLYNQHGAGASVAFGDTAMTENFADCGGMDKSLRALRALGPLSSQRLADREFSAEQLFFVASCYKWCSPVQSGAAGGSAEVIKQYAPDEMRCNVPLINTPEFAFAFNCSNASPMSSAERCEVF